MCSCQKLKEALRYFDNTYATMQVVAGIIGRAPVEHEQVPSQVCSPIS
jgi:hypothetical protein